MFPHGRGFILNTEFENAIHFFYKFEILLILIFKLHSPAEIFLHKMNYAHTLLNLRQRRWVKNAATPSSLRTKILRLSKTVSL